MSELELQLAEGVQQLGIALEARQSQQLLQLLVELQDWNSRINLTAITDPVDAVRKHLLDSLGIHPYLHGRSVADVGTGAGFPGLPLAVVNRDREFTLIESTGKKARFVEHACARLELANVTVVNARAEQYRPRKQFDSVIARALGNLQEFIRVAGHLCAAGGRLLAMKGKYPQSELEALPENWRLLAAHPLIIPGLEAQRYLLELVRRGKDKRSGH